jgi:hypothetical protein
MNVNEALLERTFSDNLPPVDYLADYNLSRADIEEFLFAARSFEDRQAKAIEIIEAVFSYHGKEELLRYLTELARIESGIKEIQPWLRDHVVHALLSFVLGIYINERLLKGAVNRFVWKLAGLLHDVAYPIEVAHNVLASLPSTMSEIARRLEVPAPTLVATTKIDGLETLENGASSLDLIQDRITSWGLNVDVLGTYREMQAGRPCHGMYSALAVLRVLDLMYQKYNPKREHKRIPAVMPYLDWNQRYFEQEVVCACTAIFLHNLPPARFNGVKISRQRAPVAFLLKLCDALQDWERPSKREPAGTPATAYDIDIRLSGLSLSARVENMRKTKIRNEIESVLDAPDVQVV